MLVKNENFFLKHYLQFFQQFLYKNYIFHFLF
ncbi:hypothetical protein XFF6991_4940 [Xanthomonas phaseoli pv. phaseoli]|uniref:Uncharacterized protein n=1 Tax=Xanthomonas campestris pv. phaseoli TaxID=317013 RepID=A0A7Z7IVA7_XANCH|nr:hypothetical protein XFF6991_4940 [Xanthomonas phaseoli pv. phaseoli]